MTRLILVRHGQSEANAMEIGAGQKDYPLTELGKFQAELTTRYLIENEKIDKIYSSDLQRAYNTALPTAQRLGLEITTDKALREIDTGDFAGMKFSERNKRYPKEVAILKQNFGAMQYPNGESAREAYERVVTCVCRIAEENNGKCVLIATHNGALRLFKAFAAGLSWKDSGKVGSAENASICIFEYHASHIESILDDYVGHLINSESTMPEENRI